MSFNLDMYSKYETEAEMVEARKEEIMDNCMESDPEWVLLRDLMMRDADGVEKLLGILREASKAPHRDLSQYHHYMVRLVRAFDDAVIDTTEEHYDLMDYVVSTTMRE